MSAIYAGKAFADAGSLPGMLILVDTLPFRDSFRKRAAARATTHGINASVVRLLGAALYNPLWTSSIKTSADLSPTV